MKLRRRASETNRHTQQPRDCLSQLFPLPAICLGREGVASCENFSYFQWRAWLWNFQASFLTINNYLLLSADAANCIRCSKDWLRVWASFFLMTSRNAAILIALKMQMQRTASPAQLVVLYITARKIARPVIGAGTKLFARVVGQRTFWDDDSSAKSRSWRVF